jgi:hypothetical protein
MFRLVTEEEESGGGGREAAVRTPNRHWTKAAGVTLGGVLVLGAVGGGWAYWQLNGNIRSVDIDAALGDDRPHAPVGMPMESGGAPGVPAAAEKA